MMCRVLKARVPADLILKIRKAEGWARVEGDTLATIRRAKQLYDIQPTREGLLVATRKECGQ